MSDETDAANYWHDHAAQLRADLDLANARVAVLREGLDAAGDEILATPPGYRQPEHAAVLASIDALLASPDDAATKLLAVRDAAVAWKETYDAIQRAPALSPQLIAEDEARERALWATVEALTGPGTSEGGQVATDNARLRGSVAAKSEAERALSGEAP